MELFTYNIFNDFKLRHAQYKCSDSFIAELARKLNFSEDLAKDYISLYLIEQIKILISWTIVVMIFMLLTTIIAVLISKLLLIIPFLAFIALFFIHRKMRYCIRYFTFNCNMHLSLLSLCERVDTKE